MPVTVNYITDQSKIHTGSGFLYLNILRPPYLMLPIFTGNPPQYSDPPAPKAWAATTAFTYGELIAPTTPNGYYMMCTTPGTTGATEPTWSTTVGATFSDGTATWTCVGPAYAWTAAVAVPYGAEIRDSNGNIQFVLTAGTTGATVPASWGTGWGQTTTDGTVTWVCLGPTIAVGATEGEVTFEITPKLLTITADQYTGPIAHRPDTEMAKLTGTLEQTDPSTVKVTIPGTAYTTGTDPNQATGAQAFEMVTTGEKFQVLTPCVCVVSPRANFSNPNKYVMGWIQQAAPVVSASFPISLHKMTTYKVDFEGEHVTWMPGGSQLSGFARLT